MSEKLKERIYLIAIIISTLCVISSVLFSLSPAITAAVTFISIIIFSILYFVVPTKNQNTRNLK